MSHRPGSGESVRREYSLVANDVVYATLAWEGVFGSLARAVTDGASWTFKRTGFLTSRITARLAGTETEVAALQPSWGGGGTLTTRGGLTYGWTSTGFFQAQWGFTGPGGQPVLQFVPKFAVIRRATEVVVEPSARAVADVPLLVCLGWYMMVSIANEHAAMAMIG